MFLHLQAFRNIALAAMPRKARIETWGALHHVMARGIERRRILVEDQDRI
jgi:hypothetical protein